MEPSAMLVAALKVKIGRPGQIRFVSEHGGMAASRFEPDVEDVGFLLELLSTTCRTLCSGREQRISLWRVPGICAGARKKFNHPTVDCGIVQRFAASLA